MPSNTMTSGSLDKAFENIQDTLTLSAHPGLDMLKQAQDQENAYLASQLDFVKLRKQIAAAEKATVSPITISAASLTLSGVAASATATKDLTVENNTDSDLTLDIAIAEAAGTKCFSIPALAAAPAGALPQCASGSPLAAHKKCTVSIKITEPPAPAPSGGCAATLMITDSVSKTPQMVPLSDK